MFTNTSFESIAKTMKENAEKFSPAASQEAFKPVMDQLKAWGDLTQKQAQAAQAAMAETVESFKNIKEPKAAFEALKASAESSIAIASQNLKDVTALGVAQFQSSIDTMQKSSPAPEAFASVAKGFKDAASKVENALESAMKNGAVAAKKARGA